MICLCLLAGFLSTACGRASSQDGGELPAVSAQPSPTPKLPRVASRVELRALSGLKRAYQLVEFEVVTDGVYANPFDPAEVELQVLFTSPDGDQSLVPAFWQQDYDLESHLPPGEPGWRARFTPVQAGEWSAQAFLGSMLRSDTRPLTSEVVPFQVEPEVDAKGFVRLHPTNPGYLAFESGETFFPIGINMGWGSADQLPDYERWLDGFSANGGNLIRIWMASWSFGLEWDDTGLGDYTNRLPRAWMLDQVFRMAEQRGVYIELVLINHGAFSATVNPQWEENPYNAANGGPCQNPQDFATNEQARQYFKRRLRYIAARWAYSPALLAWEWWNEAEWTPISNSQMRAWIEEMTPVLQSNDPYGHLISTSYAHSSTPEVNGMEQINFSQVHLYSQSDPALEYPDLYADWIKDVPGKPVLFGEFGASTGGEDTRSDDRQGLHLHNALWASTFSGYASTAMYWWWDSYVDPLGLWKVFGRLDRFLEGEDMAELGPARGVLSSRDVPYLIRMNDRRALVWLHDLAYELNKLQRIRALSILQGEPPADDWEYLPEPVTGLTLQITGLQDGSYRAYWYSPNRGEWLQADDLEVVSAEVTLAIPDFQSDLAVKVLPAGESGPAVP